MKAKLQFNVTSYGSATGSGWGHVTRCSHLLRAQSKVVLQGLRVVSSILLLQVLHLTQPLFLLLFLK